MWDLFLSERIFKIARFLAFTGKNVLTSALFSITHYARTVQRMDLKFWHKLVIGNTEGFVEGIFDRIDSSWNIKFLSVFFQTAEFSEKRKVFKWP